ncbi:MAG: hypothetical protein U1E60_18950 [Reyranellaceae bacterium]
MTPSYNYAPTERNTDDVADHRDTWQPLRLPLQRLADRLRLQRERAVVEFQAAGINVEAD